MYISAIIPAAGSGRRIRKEAKKKIPKQFWPLGSSTVLGHVLAALEESPAVKEIIIACAPEYRSFCAKQIVKKMGLKKVKKIVSGGKERVHSVKKCIKAVSPKATHILVQDAVRPFLTKKIVNDLTRAIKKADGISQWTQTHA